MRYSEDTKTFWKLGWRLFGGRFLNFMGGYKNDSQVVLGETSKSVYDPEMSALNFAVPSAHILRSFDPYLSRGGQRPGILLDMLQCLSSNLQHQSTCLTYDGKKLKLGLTDNHGDVDLLGFEEGETLIDRQHTLQNKMEVISQCENLLEEISDIAQISEEAKNSTKFFLLASLKDVSIGMQEIRELKRKKEYSKEKLIERGGDTNWRKGKYVYAISAIIAFIHDIDEYLQKAGQLLEHISQSLAYFNQSQYTIGKNINLSSCENYIEVPDVSGGNTRHIKQRSEEWFNLRKSAKVTGSTIYTALGLDGTQRMKEHFEHVICGIPKRTPSEEIKSAMEYGTANEANAIATIVGKVLPTFYPHLKYFEEGCVEVKAPDGKTFMIVSPDGSLRDGESFEATQMAVEVKCPVRTIHTKFPPRYLLQCLAEMEALNVESLLYLCWTPDDATVFKVERDTELFQKALRYSLEMYGAERPKKPSKLPSFMKEIQEEIRRKSCSVEFMGQFSSLLADQNVDNIFSTNNVTVHQLTELCSKLKDVQGSHYELQREKASEAMMFLCCDLDRSWEKNSIKSAPVCWFPKGYSLQTETLRKVAEDVHTKCYDAGIHVPAQSFDGQWHNLVVRAIDGSPLTILQLQKDIWKEVGKIQKSLIIKDMKELNRHAEWSFQEGRIICTNGGKRLPKLKMQKKTHCDLNDESEGQNDVNEASVIADAVPDTIIAENDICGAVLSLTTLTEDAEMEALSSNVDCKQWARILSDDSIDLPPDDPLEDDEARQTSGNTFDTELIHVESQHHEHDGAIHDSNMDNTINKIDTDIGSNGQHKHIPTMSDARNILALLQTDSQCNSKGKWNFTQEHELYNNILSTKGLSSLRDIDLRVVVRYFKSILRIKVKESCNKQSKIDNLAKFLSITENENILLTARRKPRTAKSIKDLTAAVLSKSVSKHDLNVSYAEYIWPNRYASWIRDSPLCNVPKVNNTEKPEYWFYVPEYSEARQQLEVRCIDSTHLLTRMRRKSCRGGLDGVSNKPWLKVAKAGRTFLSPIMVEEVVEPMSTMMAVTHFSESVETEMRSNGDIAAAQLCSDIRTWWNSEDSPGIPASQRVEMRIKLRQRLLGHLPFDQFPPPGMFAKGWPLQLIEAVIANIDAKCLLYALCHKGTYNVRAFSSMMGETFFSELCLYDKRGQGTVTAEEFRNFIGSTVEKIQIRLDPDRYMNINYLSHEVTHMLSTDYHFHVLYVGVLY